MLCTCLLSFVIAAALVIFFKALNRTERKPIFGVYKQKNQFYWLKFVAMYSILRAKQLWNHLRRIHQVEVGKSPDGTIHIHKLDEKLENKYYLGDNDLAIDAVYFNGLTKDGEVVVCGIARRPKNVVDAFLYLKVKGEDLLLSPELPDTYQEQIITEQGDFKIKGLNITNFMPMRTWRLSYNGNMKPRNNPDKTVTVEMDLTWSAVFTPFNYDTQMAPLGLARDIAREKWSSSYFKLLKKLHQTHYEQMGVLEGTLSIDGKNHSVKLPCVRDHSFGPYRNWRTFHRYVYHFMFLENGDCMAIGTVCQPAILSHLTIGYICLQSDQVVLPIQSSDFQLYQHGENQIMPKDYGFSFVAGHQHYTVKVQVNDETTFYIGKTREAKFYERWCDVEINGVKGSACVEWQYNNLQSEENK